MLDTQQKGDGGLCVPGGWVRQRGRACDACVTGGCVGGRGVEVTAAGGPSRA